MKKLLSVSLCVMLALFILPLSACNSVRGDRYANASSYTADSSFTYGNEIRNINVDWEIGKVTVKAVDGDTFKVKESYMGSSQTQKMHYLVRGSTLFIEFWASGKSGKISEGQKELTLEIPKNLTTLEIETEGADIYSTAIYANTLSLDSETGDINAGELFCTNADVDSERGSVKVIATANLSRLELGSDRKDITLDLNDIGATIYFESDRGKISTSLTYNKSGRTYTFGNGALSINAETDRSDLIVK